jgi:mRNA-binding protein PUF3
MAQRGPVGSKPAATAAMNTSNVTFKYPPGFSDYADEGDGNQFMAQKFDRGFPGLAMATQRQAQDPSSLNAVGSGPSRKSISGLAETDLPPQTSSFDDFTYSAPTAPAMHSQRPSLAGSSYSTHHNNDLGFDQNVGRQLAETFGMMSLDNTPNGAMNALQDAMAYANGAQNFQFNPVSQPWENGQGHSNEFAKDAYGNGTSFEKRGSIVGRNSPAGSAYRSGGGLNSPRSFTGTPQPNADAWSRPTSRDPRMAAELARRGLADAQAQFAQQPTAPFFPNPFYPQNYAQNYAQFQSPYGPYSDPRHPAHMAGYGISIPPYGLGAAGVPTRPARDQDPGKSLRSALLHDFKHSPKSKRWELKVRCRSRLCLTSTEQVTDLQRFRTSGPTLSSSAATNRLLASSSRSSRRPTVMRGTRSLPKSSRTRSS